MYLIMTVVVVLFAAIGYLDRKADKKLFCIELFLLGAMLCLRYGQGTDYFGYEVNYSIIPEHIDINFLFHNDVHGEIGYQFVVEIFRNFGVSFCVFIAVWSLAIMLMTYYGIKGYSGVKTIAVLLLYPTYYLTFYYGVRQGFALAFVLCFILPAYVKNKKAKYVLLVCLGATIHKSLLVLLVLIFVDKIVKKYEKEMIILAATVGGALAVVLKVTGLKTGYISLSPSYAAIVLRIILFIAITRLYRFSGKGDEINNKIYNFYLVGFCIYLALCPMAFISGRTTAYFKISEVILFSRLLGNMDGIMYARKFVVILKRHVCMLIIAICMVEGIKNINSYVLQGEYYSGIYFYNYPYVSVFNKKDIYKYRENEFLEKFPKVFQY